MVNGTNAGPASADGELRRRAARIRLVLTDNDGVLTDNAVYYAENGESFKRFSIRDGMGVQRLRESNIETGIISGEPSLSIVRRAEKLRLRHCYLGVADKVVQLQTILETTRLKLDEIAYIGDDVNDLGIIREIRDFGLTAAPADAMPMVRTEVHYLTNVPGGHGAFRDFAEWILALRAVHPAAVNPRPTPTKKTEEQA